jgi:hypothetical protein
VYSMEKKYIVTEFPSVTENWAKSKSFLKFISSNSRVQSAATVIGPMAKISSMTYRVFVMLEYIFPVKCRMCTQQKLIIFYCHNSPACCKLLCSSLSSGLFHSVFLPPFRLFNAVTCF